MGWAFNHVGNEDGIVLVPGADLQGKSIIGKVVVYPTVMGSAFAVVVERLEQPVIDQLPRPRNSHSPLSKVTTSMRRVSKIGIFVIRARMAAGAHKTAHLPAPYLTKYREPS